MGTTASIVNPAEHPELSIMDEMAKAADRGRKEQERVLWLLNVTPEFAATYPSRIDQLVETLGKYHRPVKGIMAQARALSDFDVKVDLCFVMRLLFCMSL